MMKMWQMMSAADDEKKGRRSRRYKDSRCIRFHDDLRVFQFRIFFINVSRVILLQRFNERVDGRNMKTFSLKDMFTVFEF